MFASASLSKKTVSRHLSLNLARNNDQGLVYYGLFASVLHTTIIFLAKLCEDIVFFGIGTFCAEEIIVFYFCYILCP